MFWKEIGRAILGTCEMGRCFCYILLGLGAISGLKWGQRQAIDALKFDPCDQSSVIGCLIMDRFAEGKESLGIAICTMTAPLGGLDSRAA